jgi:hypothetical protein
MIFFRNADLTSLRGLPILAALVLTIGTRALGQGAQPNKPETETVRGMVINAVTQAPIPRALVLTADDRAAVLTDSEGHFEIRLPKQDASGGMIFSYEGVPRPYIRAGQTFFLIARKPGFVDDVGDSSPTVAPSSGDDLTIALTPEAIIKGRITLASNDAALGIMVQLFSRQVVDGLSRWTQGKMARANSSGEFRFADLQPGSYKLVTREFMDNDPITNVPGSQQFGYPPVYYPGAAEFSAASTIELTAGQEFEADLSLTRQAYYPVRIPIANAPAIGGLNVSVQGQRGPGYALGYNASEQRLEGLLPNGNYVVEASTFGQNSNGTVGIRVTGAPVDGPAITLVPNSSIQLNVNEEFTDTAWTTSVTWSDGKRTLSLHGPRTYLQASVESADDFAQRQFRSLRPPAGQNDESLVIENLLPGRYWLRLHTSRGYIASVTQGPTDVLQHPLVVGSGPAAPIEITVRDDVAELDGTVTALAQQTSLSAQAAAPAQVWIYCVPLPDSAGEFSQFGVAGDGKFTSMGMAPGDYRILAFSAPHPRLPYRDPEGMKAYESKGTVVHLGAGQKAAVQVQTILSE